MNRKSFNASLLRDAAFAAVTLAVCLGALCLTAPSARAATKERPAPKSSKGDPDIAALLQEAQDAYARGDRGQAFSIINKAIRIDPQNVKPYFARGRLHSALGESAKAIEDFDRVLRLNASEVDVYHLRGVEHFILGHVTDAVKDFNQYVALDPQRAPYHWQRGIALYYADRFAEGRQQFESHQTVNTQDVENAAWHFFCVARAEGPEKARVLLLPVVADTRVPMMQIHALLAGKATPQEVLDASQSDLASPATKQRQMFYAHLYLGLYYEVMRDPAKSMEHIDKAVQLVGKDDYMGKVALVHAKIRKAEVRSIKTVK